jgi:hypothetical protein
MVIVRFNQWEEFLSELKSNPPDERTIRLTFSLRYDGQGAAHMTLVAGYLAAGSIVEFVHYLGLQPTDRNGQRAQEIQRLFEERRKLLGSLGFTVKSGRYHVPPTLQR